MKNIRVDILYVSMEGCTIIKQVTHINSQSKFYIMCYIQETPMIYYCFLFLNVNYQTMMICIKFFLETIPCCEYIKDNPMGN